MSSVCVVTGISAGIGKAAAVALARRGVQVIGVVRDAERGRAAVKEIRDRAPGSEVDLLVADLSAMDDVRQLAEQIRTRYDHLDVLLHNAGVALYRRETTVDGYERMFATNHLAPYLLTRLLLDRLEATGTKPARVVIVSSRAHRQVRRIPWDDLQSSRSYSAIRAYNLSKLANVLFVRALAERLDQQAVVANAVSPGFVRTELNRAATLPFRIFFALVRPLQRDPETGADTPVWAATSPEAAAVTGNYFEKRRPATTNPLASDRDAAERMWAASAELCNLTP